MKTPKIINAIELIDNELIDNANKAEKKPFYIKPVFKRATAIAACLAIVAVSAFALTNKTNNDITSNNSSETSSQNKKVIYVTGDTADGYDINVLQDKSLSKKYISHKLQEKIALYKDYKDDEVVYQVIVELFMANEEVNQGNKLADADKEVQLLFEQREAAYLEEQKARAEYSAFYEANPGNEPELIAERERMFAIIEGKEKISNDLNSKWLNLRDEIVGKYILEARTERLKFATQFSEKDPVATSYNEWAFYMDLTAEEINILAEKGGYAFRLSSNDLSIDCL